MPDTNIFVGERDRERLKHIADLERRTIKGQFQVILEEALERRGIDPDTLKTLAPDGAAGNGES